MASVLVAEDGTERKPEFWTKESVGQRFNLIFENVIPGQSNYKLHIPSFTASFGEGLVEVPLPTNNGESTTTEQ